MRVELERPCELRSCFASLSDLAERQAEAEVRALGIRIEPYSLLVGIPCIGEASIEIVALRHVVPGERVVRLPLYDRLQLVQVFPAQYLLAHPGTGTQPQRRAD